MSSLHYYALPPETMLDEFRIDRELGHGGFGITYLATDTRLDAAVAIKEYMPNDIAIRIDNRVVAKSKNDEAGFSAGLEDFLREAQTLNKLKHANIVRVTRYIEANGTAYMVTEYEHGRTMTAYLNALGRPPTTQELLAILMPLLDGLEKVHDTGFLHRDIKPDNIYLCDDGRPLLLDFGAARQAVGARSKSVTSILTEGYAPMEQYSTAAKGKGPWSDIYALAGVLYRAITGTVPVEATARSEARLVEEPDPLPSLSGLVGDQYPAPFLAAIEHGLQVLARNRPQSIAEWRAEFTAAVDDPPAAAPVLEPAPQADEPVSLELQPGFMVEEFRIERVLGQGGFGITYLAIDTFLDTPVAIKEYLPHEIAYRGSNYRVLAKSEQDLEDFLWGLERFVDEARTLAKLRHPNIVRVARIFEGNGTGYMVTEYEQGRSLTRYLADLGTPPDEPTLMRLLLPLLDGLDKVHANGFLHRDIKPDNIYVCDDGRPLLLDFGSARQALGGRSKSITSIATQGYAPMEQYSTDAKRQGPWTDIYSMAAVLYRAIDGKIPVEATARSEAKLANDLSGASLANARLVNANLTASKLKDTIFVGALMIQVVATDADLSGANLSEAKLKRADFSRSDLMNVTWRGAMVIEARLEEAKHLDCTRFQTAYNSNQAILDKPCLSTPVFNND